MAFRIVYYVGDTFNIKTRFLSGKASLADKALEITGEEALIIPFVEINHVEMSLQGGLGRVITVVWQNKKLFLSVVRLNIFGYFVVGNFFGTGKLHSELQKATKKDI